MKIDHKSAYHDYEILDEFEAGVALIGPEVKSIKLNHASLEGSFVKLVGKFGWHQQRKAGDRFIKRSLV